MKSRRHVVTVKRPTKTLGTLGEEQGQPEIVMANWPCSIRTLTGAEQERARQNGVVASYSIEGYWTPDKQLDETCFLSYGTRTINIAQVEDVDFNGQKMRLLCGENK